MLVNLIVASDSCWLPRYRSAVEASRLTSGDFKSAYSLANLPCHPGWYGLDMRTL